MLCGHPAGFLRVVVVISQTATLLSILQGDLGHGDRVLPVLLDLHQRLLVTEHFLLGVTSHELVKNCPTLYHFVCKGTKAKI